MRLGQVILNLVNNAIKFTNSGEVELSIRTNPPADGEVELAFSFRDTGIGMTDEQQQRLFRAFSQAETSTTRQFGGTGLGLAISKQIVELMEGGIAVESEPGVGSKFDFTIMLGMQRNLEAEVDPSGAVGEIRDVKALVIDDNQASRDILSDILNNWGMRVTAAASGGEAVAMIREAAVSGAESFGLILMDWTMPGLDGLDTTRLIRDIESIPETPTVVMVTADETENLTGKLEDLGVRAFLVKPVERSALFDAIAVSLEESSAQPTRVSGLHAAPRVAPEIQGANVLVVEDIELNQQVAVEILSNAGVTVEIANNGRVAVERVLAEPRRFDAVLMDIQMPVMDGLDATREIRKTLGPEELPIIAVTAHVMEREREYGREAGLDEHVTKPIDPATLIEVLNRMVKPRAGIGVDTHRLAPPPPGLGHPIAIGADDLPDSLPPFDIEAALNRLNGKKGLLRKLIVTFGKVYCDSVSALRHHMANDEMEEACRLVHTVKGAASNLEASVLYDCAEKLEAALHDAHSENLLGLADEFAGALSEAVIAATGLDAERVVD